MVSLNLGCRLAVWLRRFTQCAEARLCCVYIYRNFGHQFSFDRCPRLVWWVRIAVMGNSPLALRLAAENIAILIFLAGILHMQLSLRACWNVGRSARMASHFVVCLA